MLLGSEKSSVGAIDYITQCFAVEIDNANLFRPNEWKSLGYGTAPPTKKTKRGDLEINTLSAGIESIVTGR